MLVRVDSVVYDTIVCRRHFMFGDGHFARCVVLSEFWFGSGFGMPNIIARSIMTGLCMCRRG